MCSVSGFGQSGPYSGYKAYASMLDPLASHAAVTGFPEDLPTSVGISMMDPLSGLFSAFAVLSALERRDSGGSGTHIDCSMLEVGASLVHPTITHYAVEGTAPERVGNRDERGRYVQGVYRCAEDDVPPDREAWVAIALRDQRDWEAFVDALDSPDWAGASAFGTQERRLANHDRLDDHIEAWTERRNRYGVAERLREAGVPAGVVQSPADLLERDDHLRSREFWQALDHPVVGQHEYPGRLPRVGDHREPLGRYAPMLGQHSREVCYDLLDISGEEIADLEERGVLG
jgi:crotonobetainyl-CoA:carnitine CoA-transferase CaiB-like acyl-CoA transferase